MAQGLSLLADGFGGPSELVHCISDIKFADGLDICKVVQVGEPVYVAALVQRCVPGCRV